MFSSNSSQVSDEKLYSEDVFSCFLYTGTGSAQTIVNGIDLTGKGGLVWTKARSSANSHYLWDTARGNTKRLSTDSTAAEGTTSGVFSFNNNGFTDGLITSSGVTLASWTFRKAPKFFDVVTYTGNDTSRSISHNLGVAPGCIIVKNVSQGGFDWIVYHRSNGATKWMKLNATDAVATNATYFPTDPTSTTFAIGAGGQVNNGGDTYVAYLFAHDTTSDGIIQCGSYNGTGGSGQVVTLGWEPQWVMVKSTIYAQDWIMLDNMRGMPVSGGSQQLKANLSNAENNTGQGLYPTATGFGATGGVDGMNQSGETYIYIAIRRGPMRTPTTGTSVYNAIARTGNGTSVAVTGAGFSPDLLINGVRPGDTRAIVDRIRGTNRFIRSNDGSDEAVFDSISSFDMNGFTIGADGNNWFKGSGVNYVHYLFKRAPNFFDTVCYTGTGSTRTVSHNLGVAPELMIVKMRSSTGVNWRVYSSALSNTEYLSLNSTAAKATGTTAWNSTSPTSTVFTVGSAFETNDGGNTYVAELFASCPGVSKVGTYTGNGSSQTINCGFSGGARFVLIKRTDSTGNWLVGDTARGLVAGNDPLLYLNSTAAEITTLDWLDTDSSGFVVNQDTTANANVNGATYIYLAVA